ncbi:MAG TPA: hypothetical protein VKB20_08620, partial [Steroidobacteraceae bacterium]|nr:hypothetical protein [Steroidobacteraceae bacterium]
MLLWYITGALVTLLALRSLWLRLLLSRAKHPSLGGHSRIARLVARLVRYYEYDETRFFNADDAPADVTAARRAAFTQLAQLHAQRFPKGTALTREVAHSVSDLQFTMRYRVPFQFGRMVRQYLPGGTFLESSAGVTVADVDGNRLYDVSGSYGVNLFGYDFYKECIERGMERVCKLGPVLGSLHPVVAYNVERLK